MTRNDIIKELERRGYEAESCDNIKNGVVFEGIIIKGKQLSPIIYTEKLIEDAEKNGRNVYSVASQVMDIYEWNDDKEISIELLCSKEFFLNHVYIGIQKKSEEDIEKRDCELDSDGLENYLIIKYTGDDGVCSMKMNDYFLKKVGIERAEAWKKAIQNVCDDTVIESMNRILSEMLGIPYDADADLKNPLYIVSSSDKVKGASAILNHEELKKFGKKHGVNKILVLPSSIHEMLISPYQDWMDIDEMKAIVTEINAVEVAPEERLTDQAYIINL